MVKPRTEMRLGFCFCEVADVAREWLECKRERGEALVNMLLAREIAGDLGSVGEVLFGLRG